MNWADIGWGTFAGACTGFLTLIGALPAWPHSRRWGYGPSGALGVILLVIVVMMLAGRF